MLGCIRYRSGRPFLLGLGYMRVRLFYLWGSRKLPGKGGAHANTLVLVRAVVVAAMIL